MLPIASRYVSLSREKQLNAVLSQLLNEIMPMIYKRFTEKAAEEWRQIYKVSEQPGLTPRRIAYRDPGPTIT